MVCRRSHFVSKLGWIALLGCALLAACSPAGPVRRFVKGEELHFNDFSQPNSFEHGSFEGARLQIADDVYRITVTEGDSSFWWGQWGEIYDNVVIDVDVNQLSERNDNMYGIMCRMRGAVGLPITPDPELQAIMSAGIEEFAESTPEASDEIEATEESTVEATEAVTAEATGEPVEATETVAEASEEAEESEATEEGPAEELTEEATAEATDAAEAETSSSMVNNGDGYLFLIRGDRSYAIMRARGRDVQALVNWGTSNAINPGPGQNHIRAVCLDDYLALYVNDQFVADANDDAYLRGQVGLTAASVDRLGVQVEFDNLTISQANPE
jgi:hypothetical protein